jgi:hypothetical protein
MDDINHKIDLKGMAQPTRSTCWLASYRMILKAAGKPYGDDVIREKLRVFGIDFDDALENGLDGKDWAPAAWALGFAPMIPLQYKMDGGAFDRAFGRTNGQKAFLQLLAKSPLWIGRWVGAGKSHAIIARGFDSWANKVIWINPQNEASSDAFESRSALDLFIGMIAAPMGGVQLRAA